MIGFLGKIFKSSNQRRVDGYAKVVDKINSHDKSMAELSEDQFKQFKLNEESRDENLVKVFAAVREASKRTIGLRHYDCQMIGGLVLDLSLIHI